jgi:hypothetical protein
MAVSRRTWVGAETQPDIMALEDQTRLFTPFTRLDRVRAREHGLGPSIVRRMEKLGGRGVESQPGQTTPFHAAAADNWHHNSQREMISTKTLPGPSLSFLFDHFGILIVGVTLLAPTVCWVKRRAWCTCTAPSSA